MKTVDFSRLPLEKDDVVLDLGCGEGRHVISAYVEANVHSIGVDLSMDDLRTTRERFQSFCEPNNEAKAFGLSSASALCLPFADDTFDKVICSEVLEHIPEYHGALREIERVLKPGGSFALVDNVSPDASTTPGFGDTELQEAAQSYNTFEKIRDPSHGRAWTPAEWLDCMQKAGFGVTHQELLDKAMSFKAWCKNQSVPEDKVPGLAEMLRNASPAFAAYIRPVEKDDGDIGFTIIEFLAVARKS